MQLSMNHDAVAGRSPVRRAAALLLTVLAICATVALSQAGAAHAAFGIAAFGGAATEPDGSRATTAGGHPDVTTEIRFSTKHDTDGAEVADENVKDVHVQLPPGLVGNPLATPTCTPGELLGGLSSVAECPAESQVGVVDLGTSAVGTPNLLVLPQWPVYNMEPPPGVAAQFAFQFAGVIIAINAGVGSGPAYPVTVDVRNVSQGQPFPLTKLTLWGVPSDARHDGQRWPCAYTDDDGDGDPLNDDRCPSTAPRQPLMTAPTSCPQTALRTSMEAVSWQSPGDVKSAWFDHDFDGLPIVTERCDELPFDPRVRVTATSRDADAPSGLDVEIAVPQGYDNPDGRSTAHLRDVQVTLPEGMAINPASADGLEACTDEQLGLDGSAPVRCPDASRIGSVEATSPLLAEPLRGGVFLRPQASGDPASGQMFRLALVLESKARGILVKLAGQVRVDRSTGRIVTAFDDNPQMPVSAIRVHLDGGQRAALTTPPACGTYTADVALTPWSSSETLVRSSSLAVDRGCGRDASFQPSMEAGVLNVQAGASSSFTLRLTRPAGQQELGALNASLPAGLLGVLKSVPLCPAVQAAAGTCGAQSRVGAVQVASGAGAQPLWLPVPGRPEQAAYLTEPLRAGDVAGLSIVVPAVAGPFELGTVVTKVFVKLRPKDQGVDLQSERLPRIVGGVPVRMREIAVTVDREGFMVNPTSCRETSIDVNAFSQSWVKVPLRSRFQVGGCASLPLSPVIGVSGGGKGNTARYTHPALTVTVRQAAGQAHLDRADVVLPRALNVDLQAPSLKAACPRAVYAQDRCSKVATVGTVRAVTPLLAEPLTGPAFLLQKKGELPDIVMRLRNSQMSLDLIGVLDFLKDGRIITRVHGIPDAALSSFELSIRGGKGGSLLNRSDLCAKRALTQATFRGQNGKVSVKTPLTRIGGCVRKRASGGPS